MTAIAMIPSQKTLQANAIPGHGISEFRGGHNVANFGSDLIVNLLPDPVRQLAVRFGKKAAIGCFSLFESGHREEFQFRCIHFESHKIPHPGPTFSVCAAAQEISVPATNDDADFIDGGHWCARFSTRQFILSPQHIRCAAFLERASLTVRFLWTADLRSDVH